MADVLTWRGMDLILRAAQSDAKGVPMATKRTTVPLPDDHAEPAWEVALLFPAQGEWSEDDYLWLTDHTRGLVELTDGHVEVLPMPTDEHQRIVLCLYRALYAFL